MKKAFFLSVAAFLLSTGMFQASAQQQASDVIERYERAVGFDRIDFNKTAVMTRLKVSAMGMEIPCTSIVAPQSRIRVEMTVNGQKVEIIVNGDKGWMSVPGAGVQAIPQEQIEQMTGQYDVVSSLKWDESNYDFTLLPSEQKAGKQYDVVRAVPKKPSGAEQTDIYFDHVTGLPALMAITVDAGGQKVTVETSVSDYKTAEGGIKYPSSIKATMNGNPVSSIQIEALEINYPVTDQMFAEPK